MPGWLLWSFQWPLTYDDYDHSSPEDVFPLDTRRAKAGIACSVPAPTHTRGLATASELSLHTTRSFHVMQFCNTKGSLFFELVYWRFPIIRSLTVITACCQTEGTSVCDHVPVLLAKHPGTQSSTQALFPTPLSPRVEKRAGYVVAQNLIILCGCLH